MFLTYRHNQDSNQKNTVKFVQVFRQQRLENVVPLFFMEQNEEIK